MGNLQPIEPGRAPAAVPNAAVWLDERAAMVAAIDGSGTISTCEVRRGSLSESAYLALVIRQIGNGERVVILGPSSARLGLEREYVSTYRRPDRLVDIERVGPVTTAQLVERLRLGGRIAATV